VGFVVGVAALPARSPTAGVTPAQVPDSLTSCRRISHSALMNHCIAAATRRGRRIPSCARDLTRSRPSVLRSSVMWTVVAIAIGISLIGVVATGARPAGASTSGAAAYRYPLPGRISVLDRFDAGAQPYGPGHRGVDLAAADGANVLAAGSGTVTFAGAVAGRGVVVIAHVDGVTTEYEPVLSTVTAGADVVVGQIVGVINGSHARCAMQRCLHWGAKRDGEYLDPLGLLRALGPVRLVPWDD
jgi:murein DD-endopeptidase MepM/ murein hydrolase activator NlpD